jgi:hypothetical protein
MATFLHIVPILWMLETYLHSSIHFDAVMLNYAQGCLYLCLCGWVWYGTNICRLPAPVCFLGFTQCLLSHVGIVLYLNTSYGPFPIVFVDHVSISFEPGRKGSWGNSCNRCVESGTCCRLLYMCLRLSTAVSLAYSFNVAPPPPPSPHFGSSLHSSLLLPR